MVRLAWPQTSTSVSTSSLAEPQQMDEVDILRWHRSETRECLRLGATTSLIRETMMRPRWFAAVGGYGGGVLALSS